MGDDLMGRDLAGLNKKREHGGILRGAKALMAVAVVIAAAATACTPVAPSGPFAVPAAPCADVVLVTARGSSQDVGSWEAVSINRNFRKQLAIVAPGRSLRILELGDLNGDAVLDPGGYPAVGMRSSVAITSHAELAQQKQFRYLSRSQQPAPTAGWR